MAPEQLAVFRDEARRPKNAERLRLFGLSLGFTELGVHIAMELTDPG